MKPLQQLVTRPSSPAEVPHTRIGEPEHQFTVWCGKSRPAARETLESAVPGRKAPQIAQAPTTAGYVTLLAGFFRIHGKLHVG